MLESSLPLWVVAVPIAAGILEYGAGKKQAASAGRIAIGGAVIAFVLAIEICRIILYGQNLTALDGQIFVDSLSALVLLVVTGVGLAATVFAYPYLRHDVAVGKTTLDRLPLYFALDSLFIGTMALAAVINNLVFLYAIIEATTLASALLVTFYWKAESLEAGYKYLQLCTVGITLALLGCVIFYAAAAQYLPGEKAMLITELAGVAAYLPPNMVLIGSALVLIGFGTKAGVIPFHAWLPDAHSQAPSPVSALLSGVTIKVAAYALARILTIFYPQYSPLAAFLVIIGACTMIIGILIAFAQDDLKRMLAYSSVSQMGYILMGLGIGTSLGLFGAFYHLLNHALLKSMLFLCTGALLLTSGTTSIKALAGKPQKPVTAICFFIGAFAIGGLPPLNGFWSKFTIFMAAAESGMWWAVGIAVFTSLLTLACLIRAGYRIFLYQENSDHESSRETEKDSQPLPATMWITMTVMAAVSIVTGLFPATVYPLIRQAASVVFYVAKGG